MWPLRGSARHHFARHRTRPRYDIIEFGNYDAYLAVWGVWGLQCLSEIYAALGDQAAAAQYAAVHARAVTDFNALFWNSARGAYSDWIDIKGNARSYFYVDIAFTAIIAGVANASQADALLAHYDSRLAEVSRDGEAGVS